MSARKSKKTLRRLDAFETARALDRLLLPGYRHVASVDLGYRAVCDAHERTIANAAPPGVAKAPVYHREDV
jgi:hypothetical protein